MGEYEERYPEAYGRGEEALPAATPERRQQSQSQAADDRFALRQRFGLGSVPPADTAPAWEHGPSGTGRRGEPAGPLARGTADYRGVGPRGYVRSPRRIYEDVCDRLTENPFIDASDITVTVAGSEVALTGSVDSLAAARQVEAIAREVIGVSRVRNDLLVRPARETVLTASGARIDRAAR